MRTINNLLVQLRKVCNHPDLLESSFDGSCKYQELNVFTDLMLCNYQLSYVLLS